MASEQQVELDYGQKSLSLMVECSRGWCGWKGNLGRDFKGLFCPECGAMLRVVHTQELRRRDRRHR